MYLIDSGVVGWSDPGVAWYLYLTLILGKYKAKHSRLSTEINRNLTRPRLLLYRGQSILITTHTFRSTICRCSVRTRLHRLRVGLLRYLGLLHMDFRRGFERRNASSGFCVDLPGSN